MYILEDKIQYRPMYILEDKIQYMYMLEDKIPYKGTPRAITII